MHDPFASAFDPQGSRTVQWASADIEWSAELAGSVENDPKRSWGQRADAAWCPVKPARSIAYCTNPEALAFSINMLMIRAAPFDPSAPPLVPGDLI
jgi:hypothetical protein